MTDWLWNTIDHILNPVVKGMAYLFGPIVDWIMETDQRRMTAELAIPLVLLTILYLIVVASYIPH